MYKFFIFISLFCFSCLAFEANQLEKVRRLRKLPVCEENWACCLYEKRFWTSARVTTLCRCPAPNHEIVECPCVWTVDKLQGVMISNRALLRFCPNEFNTTEVSLEECEPGFEGLNVIKRKNIKKPNPAEKNLYQRSNTTVIVKCLCYEGYWRMTRDEGHNINEVITIESRFQCQELKKSGSEEVCGVVRGDTWAAYYQGSCPEGHRCRQGDLELRKVNISEVLYSGSGYEARCIRDF